MDRARRAGYVILWFLSTAVPLRAQDSRDTTAGPSTLNSIVTYASIAPSALFVIGVHELGHYSFAKMFGGSDVRMGLFQRKPNGGFRIGWTQTGSRPFSPFERVVIDAGGTIFSRALAEGMDPLVTYVLADGPARRVASITFLIGRFDMPRYVLQDAIMNLFNHRGSDIDLMVTEIAGAGTIPRTFTYATLLGLLTADLVWDWDRIGYHWNVAAGETPRRPGSSLSIRPTMMHGGIGVAASASW